jgi:hypothetical protein
VLVSYPERARGEDHLLVDPDFWHRFWFPSESEILKLLKPNRSKFSKSLLRSTDGAIVFSAIFWHFHSLSRAAPTRSIASGKEQNWSHSIVGIKL